MGLWDKIKDGLTNSKGEVADAARDAADKAQDAADQARQKAEEAAKDAGTTLPKADAPAKAEVKKPAPKKTEPKAEKPAPKAAPKKAAPKHKTYTVKSGDTLSEIGQQFGVPYMEIAKLNKIENPDLIFPGQVFKIPNN